MLAPQHKLIELTPIKDSISDYDEIESKIKALFKREIYLPIIREFGGSSRTLTNAIAGLAEAIKSGRIQFYRGTFSGRFNAAISKELKALGARWDRKTGTFKIQASSLPVEISYAIQASASRFQEKLTGIDRKLAGIVPEEIAEKLKIADLFDSALWKVEKKFERSIAGITVAPQLTMARRKRIADEWQNNMNKWMKKFTDEQVLDLRANMQKSVFAGNRYETAIKTIQDSYGVTANKAKFLARQETNLLMSKYKQIRYQEAGVNEYKWMCVTGSANHPVRPRHKALADASRNGKLFKWSEPPITTEAGEPIRRNNPTEDYNCRCYAIPVIRIKKEK